MWNLSDFELINLGYGFYVVKFENMEDRIKVMTGGPWKIMDHYLTVQRWQPYFRPSCGKIGSTAVWIHSPELPLEYFHGEVLMNIGKLVGKPLKLDSNTAWATRDCCPQSSREANNGNNNANQTSVDPVEKGGGNGGAKRDAMENQNEDSFVTSEKFNDFGPWMLVRRKNFKKSYSNGKGSNGGEDHGRDNHFDALSNLDSVVPQNKEGDSSRVRHDDRDASQPGVQGKLHDKENLGEKKRGNHGKAIQTVDRVGTPMMGLEINRPQALKRAPQKPNWLPFPWMWARTLLRQPRGGQVPFSPNPI
ncbi:hypothetical protein REPUB_Repub11eG0139100 [Reevesia pubescens]